jgi:hypothetical protein
MSREIRPLPYNTAPGGFGGHWMWLLPSEAKRLLAAGAVFAPRADTDEAKAHDRHCEASVWD